MTFHIVFLSTEVILLVPTKNHTCHPVMHLLLHLKDAWYNIVLIGHIILHQLYSVVLSTRALVLY